MTPRTVTQDEERYRQARAAIGNYPAHVCRDSAGEVREDPDTWPPPPLAPDVATCGRCGRSWCERCDPAHGPLCPFCDHGSSTAPVPPRQERSTREAAIRYG